MCMDHDHSYNWIEGRVQGSRLGLGLRSQFEMRSVGPRSSIEGSFLVPEEMSHFSFQLGNPQLQSGYTWKSAANNLEFCALAGSSGSHVALSQHLPRFHLFSL